MVHGQKESNTSHLTLWTLAWMTVRQQPTLFVATSLAVLSTVALSIMIAGAYGHVLTAVQFRQRHTLFVAAGVFTIVAIAVPITSAASDYARNLLGARVANRLRGEVFRNIVGAPMSVLDSQHSGDLQTRLNNDIGVVEQTITTHLLNLLQDPLQLIASFVYLMVLSPTLALIITPMGPLLYVLNLIWQKPLYERSRKARETDSRLAQTAIDSIQGIMSIQAMQVEPTMVGRYWSLLGNLYRNQKMEWLSRLELEIVSGWLTWLPFVGVIFVGGNLAIQGTFPIGTLGIALQLMNYLTAPYSRIARAWGGVQAGRASLDRIQNWNAETVDGAVDGVPSQPSVQVNQVSDGPPTVAIHAVSYRYPNSSEWVINDLTAMLLPNQITAVIGPNGSGKSTLAKLLLCFYRPQRGRLTWDGVPFDQIGSNWIRHHTTYLAQQPLIMGGTVADNLRLGIEDEYKDTALLQVLRQVGLPPEFLQSSIEEFGKNMSGGQRMRVAIARALLRKAPFIILDEPTAALDSTGRMVTVRLIQKLRETHTILVVTHDEDLANAADRIISFSKESGAVGLSLGPD